MSPQALRNCCLGLAAALATVVLLPATASAEGPVRVSVLSILASESHDKVDPKLDCIAREVKKAEPKLTGFRLAKVTCKSLAVGAKESFELAAGQNAVVTIDRWTSKEKEKEKGKDKEERVQLKIVPPLLGEITYTSTCGKFLPILTRFRTADNERLILAVRVQHCPGHDE